MDLIGLINWRECASHKGRTLAIAYLKLYITGIVFFPYEGSTVCS